jgi:hypothetical protein
MAKTRKRREQKKYTPQTVRVNKTKATAGENSSVATRLAAKRRKINWIQIAAITIGVIVILSMVLAMILPGGGVGF